MKERAQQVIPAWYLVVCWQEKVEGITPTCWGDADIWEVLLMKDTWQIQVSKFPNIYI
jgi:hypothetical protein